LLALLGSAPVLAQTCPRPELNVGPVAKVHARLEMELSDGRLIRAPHLAPFEANARGAARMQQARAALEAWTRDEAIALPQRLPLADRWGRIVTPVFLASGDDLGLRLVAQGLVRVGPSRTDPCLIPLLAAEIQARNAKLGLWADSYYSVLAAQSSAALSAHAGEFVIVEGVVQRIGQTPARIYLDLGPARGSNLSVTFSRQNAKAFADGGIAPDALVGKTIRVRGLLETRTRPQIEIYTPAAIEVIGSKA
jgi:endonuclease YncB( thermonuclease family)